MKFNIILLMVLLIGLFYLSACTASEYNSSPNILSEQNNQRQAATELRTSLAEYIGNFIATADENKIETRFSLMDSANNYVSGDGTGIVRIVNSDGETVYTGTINVKKEDFGTYTTILNRENFLAYVWEIPINQVKKSISSSGTIYLRFRIKNAEFGEIDTSIWGLPTYSEQELTKLNEDKFKESAVFVGDKLSKGNFEITVTNIGFFTPLVTYREEKEYFRIDMEVKNIGDELGYFIPSGLAILDNNGNQYDSYGGTLGLGGVYQIYPQVKKSGYILFENIPKPAQNLKLVFQLGKDENYNPYLFEYNLPLVQ